MITGRLHIDEPTDTAAALGRGRAMWEAGQADCSLYCAPLDGDQLVLGAHQHAEQAVARARMASGSQLLRRSSGGITVVAGRGLLYLALGLREAGSLMTCPPGRLLNRNVRGLLAGVRLLRVPAHYFGRDFVSFDGQPGAYVGWTRASDGRALLEFFIAKARSFLPQRELVAYPPPSEPPLRGKQPTTIEAAGCVAPAAQVLERIAEGYAKAYGVDFERGPLHGEELRVAERHAASAHDLTGGFGELAWSRPIEEAIGFVGAGVALDEHGRFAQVRLCGDFMQDEACGLELQQRLVGRPVGDREVGAALDAVYGSEPGRIEGVRSLRHLRDVIIEAAERAGGRAESED